MKDFGNRNSGFRAPENYFEGFNTRLSSKLKQESLSPGKTYTGFGVPEAYFENFEVSPPKGPKIIPLFKRKKAWAYAASIAAVFILAFGLFENNPEEVLSFSGIADKNLESYIENGQINFSELEIQTFLLEETELGNSVFDGISDEAIFDYLSTHENELAYINQ